jgi:hypothetical protein
MYDASDPRASLTRAEPKQAPIGPAFPATYARFYEEQPQQTALHERTWFVRGQTFVVAYTETDGEICLERYSQTDEYALLIPDAGTTATVEANGETPAIGGYSVTFIPPGDSRITLPAGGRIVRLFTQSAQDPLAKASNAATYAAPNVAIPAFSAWPAPAEGYRIRSYSLDVQPEPGRFGRIFRGSTFMVNWLEPKNGPRDPSLLSPHHHDDFEQCSLALSGEYIHHLRWPWTTNKAHWRDDEHEICASPSVAIIPPPAIHTSEAIGSGINQLVDIFCPPRVDFSAKPGWVLNADDYPLPPLP